ncbi:MAG: HNH endonuclease [Candidatus Omnitrophota bacterium]
MNTFKNAAEIRQDGTIIVSLTQGQKTVVDDTPSTRALLTRYKFYCNRCATGKPYAKARATHRADARRTVCLHQLLLVADVPGVEVDHVNGDTLDNRATNLRLVSHRVNCTNRRLHRNNTSGVCGLYRHHGHGRWIAKWVDIHGTSRHAGFADIKYGGTTRARELAIAKLAEMKSTLPVYIAARALPTAPTTYTLK